MKIINRALFLTRLIRGRIFKKNIPLEVVLNLTNRCNFRCIYCYGPYYDNPKSDFTTEQIFKLIDELAELGTKSITLGGGEPLCRPDIGEIIDYVKSKNIECGMNTNGSLIPEKLEAVKKLDLVCVSLDGDQVSNDANRGAGTYEKIMAGIKAAQKAGVIVHTNTVLTKNNINKIESIARQAKELGLKIEFNLPFYQTSSNKNNPALNLSNDECRATINEIIKLKKQGYPIMFSEKVHEYVARWPSYEQKMYRGQKPDFPHVKCYAGRYMCFIDADGLVYPCVQLIGTFPALNFNEVGFKKAWENLANHDCRACYFVCFNEFNSIFGLDLSVILSNALISVKEALFHKEN